MHERLCAGLDGVDPKMRVARLEASIVAARDYERQLVKAGVLKGKLLHLRDWPQVIDAARQFLEADALRRAA